MVAKGEDSDAASHFLGAISAYFQEPILLALQKCIHSSKFRGWKISLGMSILPGAFAESFREGSTEMFMLISSFFKLLLEG